ESHPVSFEANRLKEIMRRDTSGVALRVIDEGRIGFSSTTDAARDGELVGRAGSLAKFGSEASFDFPAPAEYPEVETFDPDVPQISQQSMIDTGQGLIEQLLDEWPDLLCDASVGWSTGHGRIMNSAGVDAEYEQTGYYCSLGGQLIRGTDMLNVWAGYGSSKMFGETDLDVLLQTIRRSLRWATNTAQATSNTGDLPVIFTPRGVSATLLHPLISGFNGKNVANGSSPLADRWGEKIVDERISIFDDPLIPGARGSRPFDDEGVASRKHGLIENGVAGGPLLDLQTAGQLGKSSTGAAGRGLASSPSPGTSVIDIAAGETGFDEMIAGVRDGLVVEALLGAGQGNELGGDFRANVSLGYRIENGEIVGRVKDTMISGNVYKVLSQVEQISDSSEWVFGSMRSPAIKCLGVEVAAKGE
ncbi:MAG: metallopeptidase TldD-related protein, partial [Chloroflexi bacterium]|nr:metallopeptidase TldD-related protein [Chloroflexota bacterium]